jgi:hypothetical protein
MRNLCLGSNPASRVLGNVDSLRRSRLAVKRFTRPARLVPDRLAQLHTRDPWSPRTAQTLVGVAKCGSSRGGTSRTQQGVATPFWCAASSTMRTNS